MLPGIKDSGIQLTFWLFAQYFLIPLLKFAAQQSIEYIGKHDNVVSLYGGR
jgi:hypothetical protein